MLKIRKYSLKPGHELMTTHMIDEVLTNWTLQFIWKGPFEANYVFQMGTYLP